jgi:hypothetical protein
MSSAEQSGSEKTEKAYSLSPVDIEEVQKSIEVEQRHSVSSRES